MSLDIPPSPSTGADQPRRPTVALALGAGGARGGLAHIGAIEEIEAQGYRIVAIAGTSMGALIGGIHAMGKLDVYRDWVCTLARFDVFKLLDWSMSGGGLLKGEKIIGALRELIGDVCIEQLPIPFTAVATDLDREREVWLTNGSLFDAVRASIAIPTVFRPYVIDGRRLVDGALLNPLPVTPLIPSSADYLFAVSMDGPTRVAATAPVPPEFDPVGEGVPAGRPHRLSERFGRRLAHSEGKPRERSALDLLNQSMELMQANLSRLRLEACGPDLLIQLPRNVATAYQFYRARKLIERGREQTRTALQTWSQSSRPVKPG